MQTLVQILVQHKYDFGEVLGKSGRWRRKGISEGIQGNGTVLIQTPLEQQFKNRRTFDSFLVFGTYLNKLKHTKSRNFSIGLWLAVSPQRRHKLRCRKDLTPVDYFCPFCEGDTETASLILFCPK